MLPSTVAISEDRTPKWLQILILAALGIVAILQVFMVLRFEVNWDEFFLLDWVYKWNAGELNLVLQTVYFRAFSWLPKVSENEVSQIIAARGVILICLSITCGFIYSLCRKFTTSTNAVLSLLFFLTMSFVFRHASSFRADALVTMTLMGTLWCLMTPNLTWKRVLVCSTLLGFAGMITIKAIFYVPIVSVILLAHWGHSKWQFPILAKSLSLGGLSLLSFGAIYTLHSLSISTTTSSANYLIYSTNGSFREGGLSLLSFGTIYALHSLSINSTTSSTSFLIHSANGSLTEAGLFPTANDLVYAVKTNLILSILIIVGFRFSLSKAMEPEGRWAYIAALAFIFPFLTVVFYRHSHPYFYTFMLAPATIFVAIALSTPLLKKSYIVTVALLITILLNTSFVFNKSLSQNLDTQKQVLTIVHELFPTPTAYIDRCAMVSSYPKSGLFMSNWKMMDYYRKNTPIMEKILAEEQPKFILANLDSLDLDNITENSNRRFLRVDESLLKQHYIHHWGPIYIAGKSMDVTANKSESFKIYITGPYGVETQYPVQINGKIYQMGDIVQLEQGEHILSSKQTQSVTFRWDKTKIPNIRYSKEKLFHGF